MQEANMKNLQLDLIVNRHIGELNKFVRESDEVLNKFRSSCRDKFLKIIEKSFQNFIESIDSNLIIYNSENKLIKIDSKNLNNFQELSDGKNPKSEKKNSSQFGEFVNDFILSHKINFGLFNKNKLHLHFFKVNENIDNDIKTVYTKFSNNLLQTKDHDDLTDYTINDILKTCDNFGEKVFAGVNFFTFNKNENKIVHFFQNLNSITCKIQNEFFFNTFSSFFSKIENQCKKGNLPYEFDIFTTKHSVSKSFDVLLNVFLKDDRNSEDEINSVSKNLLYFANIFKINILILPLDIIMERFFKIHKFSDMKSFIKCTKYLINQIKNNLSLMIKSGMKIYVKNILLTISQSFILGYDNSRTLMEFKEKFTIVFNK